MGVMSEVLPQCSYWMGTKYTREQEDMPEPPARGRPSPVRFPSLSAHDHGGISDHRPHAGGVCVGRRRPPQPPSFPGEEQRIAQASGSGGGGGRKDERRKRDLNERR
ncbi:hypothetical protein H8959_016132 [Pygathrix nigripes]